MRFLKYYYYHHRHHRRYILVIIQPIICENWVSLKFRKYSPFPLSRNLGGEEVGKGEGKFWCSLWGYCLFYGTRRQWKVPVQNMSANGTLEAGKVTVISAVNVFAQTVVSESYILARRIPTHPVLPALLNNFQASSYCIWTVMACLRKNWKRSFCCLATLAMLKYNKALLHPWNSSVRYKAMIGFNGLWQKWD